VYENRIMGIKERKKKMTKKKGKKNETEYKNEEF
jgi:hypothetical protein